MSEPAELLPCPFCGGEPRRGLKRDSIVFCDICQYWRYEKQWNRRAPLPPADGMPKEPEWSDIGSVRRKQREAYIESLIECAKSERSEKERLRSYAVGMQEKLDALRSELSAAQKERDTLQSVLVSRHGGEPIALLSELDECRAELSAARKRVIEECAGGRGDDARY